ncbi:von Willebrand factor A domain-containing protein 8, partial [Perkinsus olseni]
SRLHPYQETGFVSTPSVVSVLEDLERDWRAGLNVCLVGPAGCGKTRIMRHFTERLSPSTDVETLFLFKDMSARDLQRRATDAATGETAWLPSAAVRAAVDGKILVLDGLDRVPADVLCALTPLISDRQCPLQNSEPSGPGLLLSDADDPLVSGDDYA